MVTRIADGGLAVEGGGKSRIAGLSTAELQLIAVSAA